MGIKNRDSFCRLLWLDEYSGLLSKNDENHLPCLGHGGYSNLWVYDLVHGGRMQITFSKYDSGIPVWSRRSSRILFASKRQHYSIYEVDSRGSEPERLVLDTGSDTWPLDISPDERFLLLGRGVTIGKAESQIWVYPMNGGGQQFRLLASEAREGEAQFSPDGQWVAYTSNESGRDEVYVVPFPVSMNSGQQHSAALQGKWQISIAGGHAPRWRQNGTEMFYLASDNTMMDVSVSKRSGTFVFESARPLFRANPGFYNVSYDVSPAALKVLKTTVLKRLASAVQLRPWPPCFQSLSFPQNPNHVPKRSNNLRTAAGICLEVPGVSQSMRIRKDGDV